MPDKPSSFRRREFLTGVLACCSVGALAAVTVPDLQALVHLTSMPLPAWASSSPQTARAYRTAVDAAPLLAQLPCYCGCMQSAITAHANLRDCYFYADGSFNPHASGCDICQSEAFSAVAWQAEGLSVDETHARIDETYGSASCTVDRCV